jgi:hypothetical protein
VRIPRFAIIPSNNRPCVQDCVAAIAGQVDCVIRVWTGRAAGADGFSAGAYPQFVSLNDPGDINISRWFNLGLQYAADNVSINHVVGRPIDKWDVAILNDDAIVPEGWFDAVSGKMREMKVAAACSGGAAVSMPVLHTQPGPVQIHTRMYGPAFILAGELGLRANEELKWWFTDDWLDWESRKLGGMVMIPGFQVQHLYPDGQMTGELQVQISHDANKFLEIYGMMPQ